MAAVFKKNILLYEEIWRFPDPNFKYKPGKDGLLEILQVLIKESVVLQSQQKGLINK